MVGQQILDLLILVRIQVSQPFTKTPLFALKGWEAAFLFLKPSASARAMITDPARHLAKGSHPGAGI